MSLHAFHRSDRNRIALLLGITVGMMLVEPCWAGPNEHLEMFLDDVNIHSMTGTKRELQQPQRNANPVITGSGGSWDADRSFGTVLYDNQDGIYKAWYQNNDARNGVSYAVSNNGLNWTYPDSPTKPGTNMLFRGEGAQNNGGAGFMKLYGASVIKDMDDVAARRYKMIYYDHDNGRLKEPNGDYIYFDGTHPNGGSAGIFTATSADGLNWTRSTTPQLDVFRLNENSIHDVVELMHDGQTGKYVIYSKALAQYSKSSGTQVPSANDHRVIVRSESSDFTNWSTPQVVIRHDNTSSDPQSYGSSVFEYEGMYIMPLRIYHNTGRADGQQGDRTIDVQLAASRDGINWTRVANKATFMPLGAAGSWDDGIVQPFRPFEKDGEINIYYHAWNGPHENTDDTPFPRDGTIGLGKLDAGRFLSLSRDVADPNYNKGTVITKTFVMDGDGLYINADLANIDDIRVNIMTENYQSTGVTAYLPGDITPVADNPLYYSVKFNGGAISLSDWNGLTISLRFVLYGGADLYGYTTNLSNLAASSSLVVVPEPAAALFFLGLAGFAVRRPRSSSMSARRCDRA
ncbi:MAG: hypothetical protein WBD40_19845 [Tepidisphaeraceae bacterium]